MIKIPETKKSLGQHWLDDDAALQAMVDSAQVQAGDVVLEIGPGYGTLTAKLLAAGAHVTALEFDANLVPGLLAEFAHPRSGELHVEQGDIRSYDFTQLSPDYAIVANIPYYLTSNLVQVISETPNPPIVAALLMQKEVAQRITAKAGDMSILSVTAQFYWQTSLGRIVEAELFVPAPKVDSQILLLERPAEPLFPDVDANKFFRLVKAGFSQKRKTLSNSLSGGLGLERSKVIEYLEAAAIDPGRRAQTLSLEEWHALYVAASSAS